MSFLFCLAEEPKEPEPEWNPFIPPTPSPILTGFYSDPGQFWLSMVKYTALAIFNPFTSIGGLNCHAKNVKSPIRCLLELNFFQLNLFPYITVSEKSKLI